MATFEPGQDTDHWVRYSALLDIWQDEEEPGDLQAFGRKLGLPQRPLSQFLDWLPLGRKEQEAEPPTGSDAGPSAFLALKKRRVWAILRFNRACWTLAKNVARRPGQWAGLDEVREARRQRREVLNDVFLACAAALRRSATPTDKGLLRALWHTELCATAPDESTIGLVNAFPLREDVPTIFWLIAKHNRARCHQHLGQHDDAVKVLESLSDDRYGDDHNPTDLLSLRLVGFSALDSMADALTHLLRHVEARWYWTKGKVLAERVGNAYWKDYFALKLAKSRAEDPSALATDRGRPRLESLFQEATHESLRDAWLTMPVIHPTRFLKTVYWKLAWHAAEPPELLSALKGAMEDLRAIAEERGRAFRQREASLVQHGQNEQEEVLLLRDTLLAARRCLHECGQQQASWLHPDRASTEHCRLMQPETLVRAWGPLWLTCRALKEVQKLKDVLTPGVPGDRELDDWLKVLADRVVANRTCFSSVVPAVELEQLVDGEPVDCLANPKGRHQPLRECPKFGCPADSLRAQTALAGHLGPRLAGVEYVLETMARSAAEFSRYLSGRTAEWVDENGKKRRTPAVEFIALRRWNSFSPNLGSLAADTVGGGYLLRVWTGGYYFGIAIDPGYNFLENLFNEGLTIEDVDLVAVTHAHPDHTDSITNLLTLLRESKKRVPKPKMTMRFAMSAGVLERYQAFLQAEAEFVPEVVMLSWPDAPGNAASQSELAILASEEPSRQGRLLFEFADVGSGGVPLAYLRAIRAYHEDGTRKDSIGFKITIPVADRDGRYRKKVVVGILGDSRYHPRAKDELVDCDLVVLHLGALLDEDSYRDTTGASSRQGWELLCHLCGIKHEDCAERQKCAQRELHKLLKKNHLYWTGTTKLICDLWPTKRRTGPCPLVVLSEFGEELRGGLRADVARRLESRFWTRSNELPSKFPGVIPADVGLRIDVIEKTVRCAVCERYWTWKQMKAIAVRPVDEGLFFVCDDCRALRGNELVDILNRRRTQARAPEKIKPGERAAPPPG